MSVSLARKGLGQINYYHYYYCTDATDYTLSTTARAFVPFYAQRISSAIVMNGACGILDGITRARAAALRSRA